MKSNNKHKMEALMEKGQYNNVKNKRTMKLKSFGYNMRATKRGSKVGSTRRRRLSEQDAPSRRALATVKSE